MLVILRILTALVVVVVLLAIGGLFLPRTIDVSRSIDIAAPPETVFPHINSLQQTEAWSPWLERDPDVQLSYSGPEAGVGNTMTWVSEDPQVGSGSQEIVVSEENALVQSVLDFGEMGTGEARFDLAPDGDGTEVTWTFDTDLGMNPAMRYLGLMMDSWLGQDFETGLARLKVVVEGGS